MLRLIIERAIRYKPCILFVLLYVSVNFNAIVEKMMGDVLRNGFTKELIYYVTQRSFKGIAATVNKQYIYAAVENLIETLMDLDGRMFIKFKHMNIPLSLQVRYVSARHYPVYAPRLNIMMITWYKYNITMRSKGGKYILHMNMRPITELIVNYNDIIMFMKRYIPELFNIIDHVKNVHMLIENV